MGSAGRARITVGGLLVGLGLLWRAPRRLKALDRAARVLSQTAAAVVLVDGEGIVRVFNRAAEAITGITAGEACDRPIARVFPGWDELHGQIPVADEPGGQPAPATLPFELPTGELWLSISGVAFDDGTVYAFRDLTAERQLERARGDMIATVSHELRTPIAAVYGAAQTLQRSGLAEADREALLRVVSEQSERLARLVEEVLTASRLDSGQLSVQEERFDPAAVAADAVAAARAANAGRTLMLANGEAVPHVLADAGRLRQVLANLIENAIKYSPEDTPVEVSVEARPQTVVLTVRDGGIGIPVEEQERIFEKFHRLDPQLARGVGGTGLGLYIARELVVGMGGRIWVEPNGNRGSAFSVELPRAR